MPKRTYTVVCAMAALGLSLAIPNAASAFPAAAGTGKAYTQTVSGNASIPVRFAGGWRGGGFGHGIGWGGRGWGGVGLGSGIGWGGRGWGWRGAGWRGGWGGGWGWPLGLGLGVAAASTYPYYGGGYPGYYGGYGGCSCGGW